MENVTDNDIFINAYLKKQEDFTVEVIRKRLEAEVKTQLLQVELQKLLAEKTSSEELLKQTLASLESVTVERDKYKDQSEKDTMLIRDLQEQLKNSSGLKTQVTSLENDIKALRDINVNNQALITELKEQLKNSSGLKTQVTSLENDIKALRDINVNNQTLITELKEQVKEYHIIKDAYETTKNNYTRVLEEFNKVTEVPVVSTKKKSKKKLPETLPESEWIDGNEIST